MQDAAKRIVENLAHVQARIDQAAIRSGRTSDQVTLVAVTKFATIEHAQVLLEAGVGDLGESRPQELWRKAAAFQDREVAWHMIGHLQSNKVRRTLPLLRLLHSGDSMRLLKSVNEKAAEQDIQIETLLEINISGAKAKHGFLADEIEACLPEIAKLSRLKVSGLMAMAGVRGDLDRAKTDFENLRKLRDKLIPICPNELSLSELSMGMSGDFEAAIEQGATMVRIGSALLEGLE